MMMARSFVFWRRSWVFLIPITFPLPISVARQAVARSANPISTPSLSLLKEYAISREIVPVGNLRQRFLDEAQRARALLTFVRGGNVQVHSLQKAYLLFVYFWSEAARFLFEGTLQGSFDAVTDGGLQCDRFVDDIRACLSLNPKGEGFVGFIPEHDWNVDATLGTVLKEKPTTPEMQERQTRLVYLLLALGARPETEAMMRLNAIPSLQNVYNVLQKWGYSAIAKNPLVYIVDAAFFSGTASGSTAAPLLASIGMTLDDVLGHPKVVANDNPSGESNGESILEGGQKTGVTADAQGESFQPENPGKKLDNFVRGSSPVSQNLSSGLASEASQIPAGETGEPTEGVDLDSSCVMSSSGKAENVSNETKYKISENGGEECESSQVGSSELTANLNRNDDVSNKNGKNSQENESSRQNFSGKACGPDKKEHVPEQHQTKLDAKDGSHYGEGDGRSDDVPDTARNKTDVKKIKYIHGILNKRVSEHGNEKSSKNDYSFLLPNKSKPGDGEAFEDLDMGNEVHNVSHVSCHEAGKDRYDTADQGRRSSKNNNETNSGSFVNDQDILNCADEKVFYKKNKKNQKNSYSCLSPNKKSNMDLIKFPPSGHSGAAFIVTIDGEDVPVRNSLSIHVPIGR